MRILGYLFLVASIAWIGGFVYFMDVISQCCPSDQTINTEAIIVLTGDKHRIETGLELLKANPSKRLFITGVDSKIRKVASVIKIFSSISRELQNKVEFGQMATCTFENASEVKEWTESNDIHSITLVTSNYHMPRSLLLFKDAMPSLAIENYPISSREITLDALKKDPKAILFLLKEYTKYSVVFIQTYTKKYIN
jgi:uncharacterized SAM-binding protein YcdF (DUF218 family)